MRPKEFAALIALLEDPDAEVFNSISNKLITEGLPLVPLLEKAWESSTHELLQARIENILHQIQLQNARQVLSDWIESGATNLLEGALNVAKYQFPDLEYEVIDSHINKIKQKVWLELNESLTALEKVKVLNHILFGVCEFTGNTDNFFDPNNHYINTLIETKKGGPVVLSIFYSIIAQRLGMPVFGVSLPKNFLLAYEDRYNQSVANTDKSHSVLFYINPFNRGAVLGKKEIEQFLTQNGIEHKDEYFEPCSNRTTISQLIASLMLSYQKVGNTSIIADLKMLLDIVATSKSIR
ncbi:MAG: transglutaminase-like domain-containing protein [Bacteroidales bacterium]|jgi:regulator of sirC expression with transglutaminase-like and TPR domain|nr:transglutaminase-like domain-containing protein [Bacteroidales bacterium]MDD4384242.1 transglutaminase-like domain-containing protein [Bacteroidales bacterium]MDY0197428.1 transglutaminase-like domain-containing protein [Tenuifilaceae bacterium]